MSDDNIADGTSLSVAALTQNAFARRTLVVIVLVTLVVSAWVIVWAAAHVFLLAFAGILLAVLLRSLTDGLSSRVPLSHAWALASVLLGLLLVVGFALWWLAPRVVQQIDQLAYDLPRAIDNLRQSLREYEWGRRLLEQAPPAPQLMPRRDVLAGVTGVFSTTLGVLVDVLVILFVGIYLAIRPGLYRTGLVRLVPTERRARAQAVLSEIGSTLHWWLAGRLALMGLNGVVTTVGLWLLGVPLALTLGLLSALLNFIPNLGPIVAGLPAVLLAATQSWSQALSVAILYVGYQGLDGISSHRSWIGGPSRCHRRWSSWRNCCWVCFWASLVCCWRPL